MILRPRHAALIAIGACLVLGFFLVGGILIDMARDLEPSAWPLGPQLQALLMAMSSEIDRVMVGPIYMVLAILGLGLGTFFFVRHARRAELAAEIAAGREADGGRREFLAGAGLATGTAVVGAVGGTGVGLARGLMGMGEGHGGWSPVLGEIFGGQVEKTNPNPRAEWEGSRIVAHRRMGRTGWEVSDIALGASRVAGEKGVRVVKTALDRGVNYIDTAPDYSAAGSEKAIGEALKGRRDQVFLATKFCTPLGNLPAGTPVADYKAAVEGSLRRLGTDHVDLIHVHGCDSIERLLDPNVLEAFEELRREGKTRFLGFSSHTPNLVEVANAAIDSKLYDVMMLAYHHGIWPQMPAVIERAAIEADMGIVAMKTLKGAKHRGLEDYAAHADAYSQAALKWALQNAHVSSAIISFAEPQHVDEYIYASGKPFTAADAAALRLYDQAISGQYCAPHCGACLESCPEGLAINDVLRHRMYFEDYGWEKEGMRLYARLDVKADVCASCNAPCQASCPLGVDIKRRASEADAMLRLA